MRISPEMIYEALFLKRLGALRRKLVSCLRSKWALCVPWAR